MPLLDVQCRGGVGHLATPILVDDHNVAARLTAHHNEIGLHAALVQHLRNPLAVAPSDETQREARYTELAQDPRDIRTLTPHALVGARRPDGVSPRQSGYE